MSYGYLGRRHIKMPPRYVRSQDKTSSINRAAWAFMLTQKAGSALHEARETLYQLCEKKSVPDSWADNPPLALTQDYDRMSLADVVAWTPHIAALPDA